MKNGYEREKRGYLTKFSSVVVVGQLLRCRGAGKGERGLRHEGDGEEHEEDAGHDGDDGDGRRRRLRCTGLSISFCSLDNFARALIGPTYGATVFRPISER